jgi:hypothetical protein
MANRTVEDAERAGMPRLAAYRRRNGEVAEFASVQAGLLQEGTETSLGIIEAVSLTAYLIDGRWVPFQQLHGRPPMAEPLVRLV